MALEDGATEPQAPAAIRYAIPSLALGLVVMLLPQSWLVLLLPAALAGFICASLVLQGCWEPLRGDARAHAGSALLILLWSALTAASLGTALHGLLVWGTLPQAIILSLVVVALLLAPWRLWPLPVLFLLNEEGKPAQGARARLVEALRRSVSLTRPVENFFIAGLPSSAVLLALAAFPLLLLRYQTSVPTVILSVAVAAYVLLLLPLAAWFIVDRVLEIERRDREALAALALQAQLDLEPQQALQAETLASLAPTDPAQRDSDDTPDQRLLRACRAGQIETASNCLAAGASPDVRARHDDPDQRSAMQAAVVCPDLGLLRALIAAGADLNACPGGLHPLIAATRDSYLGRPDAVMTLVTNGARVDCRDAERNTPLHLAARSQDPMVAEILIDAGAEVDAVNAQGHTPLAVAMLFANWTTARYLLERGAEVTPAQAVPVAIVAAAGEADDAEGIKLLVRRKKALEVHDALKRTPLHVAALAGHAEICEALLQAGAAIDAQDSAGVTPLMEAARSGSNRVLQRLAFWNPDTDCVDAKGRDALIIASISRNADAETVRLLLALGCRGERVSKDGKSAIQHAVTRGRWQMVAELDPSFELPSSISEAAGASPEAGSGSAPSRQRLISEALSQRRVQVARQLVDLSPALAAEDWGQVLYDALASDSDEVVEPLMQQLPDGELLLGHRPVAEVLASLPSPPTALLLRLIEREPAARHAELASAALAEASRGGALPEELREALLSKGADPCATDTLGTPLLLNAIRHGDSESVQRLLAAGADVDAVDALGRSALLCAIESDLATTERTVRLLIRQGASPLLRAADGASPLGLALLKGRRDLLRWLQWPAWVRSGRPLAGEDLLRAATDNDADTCERLLQIGIAADSSDENGVTALLRASGLGHLETVAVLLDGGANPELRSSRGMTPLIAAILAGKVVVVEHLLAAGARAQCDGEISPLTLAAARFEPALIERLVAAGAEANHCDDSGLAPLHALALALWSDADAEVPVEASVQALLRAGADPELRSRDDLTVLQLLAGAHRPDHVAAKPGLLVDAARVLLEAGADPDATDANQASALHWAAHNGLLGLVQRLLEYQARPGLRDRLGRRAVDLAERAGHEAIRELLSRPLLPGAQNLQRGPRRNQA